MDKVFVKRCARSSRCDERTITSARRTALRPSRRPFILPAWFMSIVIAGETYSVPVGSPVNVYIGCEKVRHTVKRNPGESPEAMQTRVLEKIAKLRKEEVRLTRSQRTGSS